MRRRLRWLQFSLRDLLWLMVVCGILTAWWQDRSRVQAALDGSLKETAEQRAEVEELQGEVVAVNDRLRQFLASLAQISPSQRALRTAPPLGVYEPRITGLVTATHKDEAIVEINLGTDHGLKPGDVLDVF